MNRQSAARVPPVPSVHQRWEVAHRMEASRPPPAARRTTPSYRLLQGVPRSLIPAKQGGKVTGMGLSERDRAILDFERVWSFERGPKEEAIRAELGLSARRYYQLLASLLDSEDADRYDPLVVRRLRRLRTERRKARLIGRPAGWRTSR